MRHALLLAALLSASACSPAEDETAIEVEVDVPALIGGSASEVEAVLGEFICSEDSGGQSCEFDKPYTSVFFIDGEAANVALPYVEDLRAYGLDLGDPQGTTGDREEWETTINGNVATVYRFPAYVYVMTHET